MNAEARRRARSAMPQAEQIARPTEWGTPTRPVLVFLPSPDRDSKTRRHWLDERCGGGHSPSVSTAVARLSERGEHRGGTCYGQIPLAISEAARVRGARNERRSCLVQLRRRTARRDRPRESVTQRLAPAARTRA